MVAALSPLKSMLTRSVVSTSYHWTLTHLESALTQFSAVTLLECALTKKGGGGYPLGCPMSMKKKARGGEQSPPHRTVRGM